MKDYGIVHSVDKPEPKVVDDFSVWVYNNIHEIQVNHEGETKTEYEFNLLQYDKNEYIKLLDEKNNKLEKELTDTQIALCDIYELVGGTK